MDTNVQPALKSLTPPQLDQLTRETLKKYLNNTWELYEMLFSSLTSEKAFYRSPDPLRNPLIFYYGHTAAFYINKLKAAGLITGGVNEWFDTLFAVGVDPDTPENLEVSDFWPTVAEVKTYRKTIYNKVNEVIDRAELTLPITQDHPLWALLMGFEHDRIHFETSSVLIRQLNVNLVEKPDLWKYAPSPGVLPPVQWIPMKGGTVHIGKPGDSALYGWDNEFGAKTTEVKPFAATRNLITNAEFMEFVKAGGYEDESLWTEEGREWRTNTHTTKPRFWIASDEGYLYRAMFDEMTMPADWPVEVNAHEALAYCAWKNDGSRLLSEAEFLLIAREGLKKEEEPLFGTDYNLNFLYGSPTPVGYMEKGATASGFNDIYGNVWEWLSDDFYPLPGFKAHLLYEDFSEPYMDEEHGMMAGGSWATTGTGASKYYRLWFRRHFFQHAGFRLAKDL